MTVAEIRMRVPTWMRETPKRKMLKRATLAVAFAGVACVSAEAFVRGFLPDSAYTPSMRFYARPIVLERGLELDRGRVEASLRRLGYKEVRTGNVGAGEYKRGRSEWVIGRRAFRIFDQLDPGGLTTVRLGYRDRISEIRDGNDARVSSVALEPEVLRSVHGDAFEDRMPVRLDDVPKHLVDAVLAIEDQRFFDHDGLDPRRVVGATIANVRARRIVQGASTLTQQLAKNLFLSHKRSVTRKVREIAITRALERRYTKERILEAYLNEVYLGQDGAFAIHGMGRGAQFFFGKDVSQLSIAEAALLAGIIRGPSLYAPFSNPEAAETRRGLVLSRMLALGKISEDEYRTASAAPLGLRPRTRRERSGRYFLDFAANQVRSDLSAGGRSRGLSVFTTLDMELQRAAEKAVQDGLTELERYYPRLKRDSVPMQAALVALDPRTGEILAMVGGRDYGQSQFNRAAQAYRQPGSSFKPIVALSALAHARADRQGQEPAFTLASVLDDRPLSVETPNGPWEPNNYDGRFRGPVTLREALEGSLNVPFARLGMAVGPEHIVETAEALGITNPLNPVLSLALGSSEVTPLELTQAYNVIAAGGYKANLSSVLGVLDRQGRLLERHHFTGEQVFEPAEAYLVTSALRGAVERGTGSSLRSLGFRGPVAAKSGTTNNYRDAWFIGYTPSITVGVWVGFDDGFRMGISGSRAALPIFAQFLIDTQGTDGDEEFTVPNGLEVAAVNHETGLLGGPGCRGENEVFLRGTAPDRSCATIWGSSRKYRGSTVTTWSSRLAPLLRELERRASRGTD